MKRAGFTMIELIFVIVILGILAAVAIPKLAATRNDATAATVATSAATCVNDAGGQYMMDGNFTNPISATSAACLDAITTSGCYTMTADDATGILTLTGVPGAAGSVCISAVALTDKNSLSNGTNGVQHQF